MSSVVDLWRAIDPEARLASGDLDALRRPVRGVGRSRSAPPHLPSTADGELLVIDATIFGRRLDGFEAYVTFLARRDPGMALLFAGAALLSACLAVSFWLPRRRITLRAEDGVLRLLLRGERFDPLVARDLEPLRTIITDAVG